MKSAILSLTLVLFVGLATGNGRAHRFIHNNVGNIDFPRGDGNQMESRFIAEKDCNLFLYTRKNPTFAHTLVIGNSESLNASTFDKSKPVKFVSHGWTHGPTSPVNLELRDDFLRALDVNFVVFDWSKGAAGVYPVAAGNVPLAGEFLAKVIDWLVSEGIPIENFHILGHSLGAHVVGIAGRSVTRGKVPFITGFDPAISLWGSGSKRIRSTDAAYVEIIHTSGGYAGLTDPLGHNDFYPNGGVHQPGCEVQDLVTAYFCSHARSWQYYGDSLDHTGYQAMQCSNYDEMDKGKCANISSLHMGGSKPKPPVGIFYLKTADKKPYYLG